MQKKYQVEKMYRLLFKYYQYLWCIVGVFFVLCKFTLAQLKQNLTKNRTFSKM